MNIDDILYRFNLIDLDESKSVLVHEAAAPKHLHIELLKSVDEFIKKNPSTKEITSPIFFQQIGKLQIQKVYYLMKYLVLQKNKDQVFMDI